MPQFSTEDFVPANSRNIISFAMPGSKKLTRARVTYLGNEVIGSAVFMFFEEAEIKGRSTKVNRFGLNAETIKRIDPEEAVQAPRRKKKRKTAPPDEPVKKTRKKKKVSKKVATKKKKVRRRRRA